MEKEINLNKLYSPNKPDFTDIGEYYYKIRNQLSNLNLRELDILIIGTGPNWLLLKIVLFLEPFVNSISLYDKTSGRTISISSIKEKFLTNKL